MKQFIELEDSYIVINRNLAILFNKNEFFSREKIDLNVVLNCHYKTNIHKETFLYFYVIWAIKYFR